MIERTVAVNRKIEEIKNIALTCAKIERIYLFGSYAYGIPTAESDIDIFVVLSDSEQARPIDVMGDILSKISYADRIPVDILASKNEVFSARKAICSLERDIASKGELIYEHKFTQ